jgi:ribosomal protein L37AE/L43A
MKKIPLKANTKEPCVVCKKETTRRALWVCRSCKGVLCSRCGRAHDHGTTFTAFVPLLGVIRTMNIFLGSPRA